jgi:hypothetical protein
MNDGEGLRSPVTTDQRPIFVVGTGRCGSTLLSEMIHLHPRVLSISEWFTVLGESRAAEDVPANADDFWRLLTVPSTDAIDLITRYPNLPELKIPSGLLTEVGVGEIPPLLTIPLPWLSGDSRQTLADLRAHLATKGARTLSKWHLSAFQFLADRHGKRMWLERSGGSLAYADTLRRSWGNARYIHIHRDGVDCALSMSVHPYFRVRVARALARTRLSVSECLQTTIPLEQFGAYWSAVTTRGLRALADVSRDDVLHISYSDLVQEPVRQLRRVQSFLEGASEAEDWVWRASTLARSDRRRSANHPTERLRRMCRPGMMVLASLPKQAA